jgi:pimeloyl-ACP methyl ester carboxylesterase
VTTEVAFDLALHPPGTVGSIFDSSPDCGAVTDTPEIRYTRSVDGTNLAYQVSGEGPIELVFFSLGYPMDLLLEDPGFIRVRRRLGTFSRTLWFDARGLGASEGDPLDAVPGEIFDADVTALLDAVGFQRPAMAGVALFGPTAIHFAVTHPQRVSALVLVNSYAHFVREEDYPWGFPRHDLDRRMAAIKESWGTTLNLEMVAPSRVADERFRAWYARSARFGGGPDQVADTVRARYESDVRALLPSISVPTLVLHREGDCFIHLGAGRYLAEHIPHARFVALPGDDHLYFVGDTDALVDEIEEFLTGARSGAEGDVLTMTVLFTDIVASTEHQARVGPREWSRLTDHHDAMVRAALARHRGREVKTTGDGFLATFDATGRALRCAAEILAGAKDIGLNLRAGVHTGEVELRGDDIAGLAVTIAKRVRPGGTGSGAGQRDGAEHHGWRWHQVRRPRRARVEGRAWYLAFVHGGGLTSQGEIADPSTSAQMCCSASRTAELGLCRHRGSSCITALDRRGGQWLAVLLGLREQRRDDLRVLTEGVSSVGVLRQRLARTCWPAGSSSLRRGRWRLHTDHRRVAIAGF